MRNTLERGAILVFALVLVAVAAVPFFLATVIVLPGRSWWGWWGLASVIGFILSGVGITRVANLLLELQGRYSRRRSKAFIAATDTIGRTPGGTA